MITSVWQNHRSIRCLAIACQWQLCPVKPPSTLIGPTEGFITLALLISSIRDPRYAVCRRRPVQQCSQNYDLPVVGYWLMCAERGGQLSACTREKDSCLLTENVVSCSPGMREIVRRFADCGAEYTNKNPQFVYLVL